MAKNVWTWNDFSGGNASDRYVGPKGSFYDSKNLNFHDSPMEAKLAKKWTQFGTTDGGGGAGSSRDIIKILTIGNYTFQITSDGRVFKDFAGGPLSFGPTYGGFDYTFEDAVIFGDYVFIAAKRVGSSRFAIFRDTVANWKAGTYSITPDWAYYDYSSVDESGSTFGTRLGIYSGNQLIIARKNRIWSISKTSSTGGSGTLDAIAPIQLTLPYTAEISALTQQSDYLRAYTFQGELYLWAGANLNPDFKRYIGLPVVRGVSDFKTDYVMCGSTTSSSSLFQVVGFDYAPIARASGVVNGPLKMYVTGLKFGNSMALSNDYLFVPELNGVMAYGRKIDGMPRSLVRQWVFEDNEDTLISAMESINVSGTPFIHVAYEKSSDSSHKVMSMVNDNEYSATDYYASGYVESRAFYADAFYKRKTIEEIHIAYEIADSTSGSINVYLKCDEGAWSSAIPVAYNGKRGWEITKAMIPAGYSDFNELRIKAELVRDGSVLTKTPKLREITVIYEDGIRN